MSNPFILVAPSTRGISRALTRHFLQTTNLPVYATHRSGDSSAVKQNILNGSASDSKSEVNPSYSSRLHLLPLDLAIPQSIEDAASKLASQLPKEAFLHTAFFTGGVLHVEKRPQDFEFEKMWESFHINTLAHMLLMKHFERFLPKAGTRVLPLSRYSSTSSPSSNIPGTTRGENTTKHEDPELAKWVHITARVGSIADNASGGWYSYRASKAALAQLVRTFDHHLRMRSVPAIALGVHPGTVRTDLSQAYIEGAEKRMGEGKGEVLDPEEAARRLVCVVGRAGERERGMMWDHRGESVPW